VRERMLSRLRFLYGDSLARTFMPELERILQVHSAHKPAEMIEKEEHYSPPERFSEQDMVLITYGDIVEGDGGTPLAALLRFVDACNQGAINTIHILPFFPYSSDRGFAIVDFKQVDPKLGTWDDIRAAKQHYDLMFDAVLNHVSGRCEMFREYLNANPHFQDYFIAYDSADELTADQRGKIFRPRTSDILTRFDTLRGPRYLWTTFSADQIDLNFRNPQVLLSVIDGLLFYVRRGADLLRLDAVTYIWAEPGTECVHLPQTHEIVKLLRDVMDAVASGVALITETNVPHVDNIAYFGNGGDEAHLVYNFALPPLVLHTFYSGDATAISRWAEGLTAPSETTTFFNILDTHDGIGLLGAKDILSREQIDSLIATARRRGAYVSFKMAEGQREEPYEINSTWWSAINDDRDTEDLSLRVKRYVASRSIALAIRGVPGIYIHGNLGTENDHDRVAQTGVKRDVNRGRVRPETIFRDLAQPGSKLAMIREFYTAAARVRSRESAFHPNGGQRVLRLSPHVFAVLRSSQENDRHVLALTNVTQESRELSIPPKLLPGDDRHWVDVLSGATCEASTHGLAVTLEPYAVVWLRPAGQVSAGTAEVCQNTQETERSGQLSAVLQPQARSRPASSLQDS
jgi:glucosylglycerate phosphorylase